MAFFRITQSLAMLSSGVVRITANAKRAATARSY